MTGERMLRFEVQSMIAAFGIEHGALEVVGTAALSARHTGRSGIVEPYGRSPLGNGHDRLSLEVSRKSRLNGGPGGRPAHLACVLGDDLRRHLAPFTDEPVEVLLSALLPKYAAVNGVPLVSILRWLNTVTLRGDYDGNAREWNAALAFVLLDLDSVDRRGPGIGRKNGHVDLPGSGVNGHHGVNGHSGVNGNGHLVQPSGTLDVAALHHRLNGNGRRAMVFGGAALVGSMTSAAVDAPCEVSSQVLPRSKPAGARRNDERLRAWWSKVRSSYAAAVVRTSGILVLADVSGVVIPILGVMQVMPLGGSSAQSWGCVICLIAGNLLAYLTFGGLYPGVGVSPVVEFRQIAVATTFAFLSYIIAALSLGGAPERWPALLVAWLLAIVSVTLARHLVRRLMGRFSWWGFRVAVAGEAGAARHAQETLRSHPGQGLRPVAMLDESTLLRGQSAVAPGTHYVLFAISESSLSDQAGPINELCRRFARVILLLPETAELFGGLSVRASHCGLAVGVELRNRLLSRPSHFAKWSFDLLLAASAVPALLLVSSIVALLNWLNGGGPLFFGHERIGRNGSRFKAWKFRTMAVNADLLLREHLEKQPELRDEWQRNHKLLNDPRVTKIGQWLRRTSLDELPQIWNVIRGEMSIVGPRPIVPGELPKYGACFDLYTSVRPGLTGLWQVSGRNNTTYPERVALDSFYSRNWSIWLDLYIVIRTFRAVLTGEGAR